MSKFKIGDKVRFNDLGLDVAFSNVRYTQHIKTRVFTITDVDSISLTYPEESYVVEIDDPVVNELLLFDKMFDGVSNSG